ncbi:tetratricopeptide repeat protein [Magnetospira sp. QH-2]|uniref:tetratricopeptide repeat protein n=1 Tax=Magnetospira sp. (strain QH-2) TaxID=1288970 RepID=UPI0003E8149E|nr:tetratricopeptide repeat protein [Magnetospira sp. QH-2]CCQ75002.1 protein of unknown function [Magnetospira sp. QH-2]
MSQERPRRRASRRRRREIVPVGEPETALAPDEAEAAPSAPPRGEPTGFSAWLMKLFGPTPKKPKGPTLKVCIAPLGNDPQGALSFMLTEILRTGPALSVVPLKTPLEVPLTDDPIKAVSTAALAARNLLAQEGGDLLVWGAAINGGSLLDLYLLPAVPDDNDRPGNPGSSGHLVIPVSPGDVLSLLLRALALAAGSVRPTPASLAARNALEPTLNAVQSSGQPPPMELDPRQRALLQAAFGHLATMVGWQGGLVEWLARAEEALAAALQGLAPETSPLDWAMVQRSMGNLLLIRAERGQAADTAETLEKAAEAMEAALTIYKPDSFPSEWAALQYRLAQTLHRLDRESSDADLLKKAITAYQASLRVYTRATVPQRWAEVHNSLALAAQVLGEDLRNIELLEKAVQACRSALEERTREGHPGAWASTRHNMASALFLLGRSTGEREILEEAQEAFAEVVDYYREQGSEKSALVAARNLEKVEETLKTTSPRGRSYLPPQEPVDPAADDDAGDEETP